jgi:hypothetical protein
MERDMGVARLGRLAALLGAALGVGLGLSALSSAQSGGNEPSATELVHQDPGARVDGNTIVAIGKEDEVIGVPDRPNFIVALGTGDRITGGDKDNELGALGENDTIVADRGHELIVAGPSGTVLDQGSGHDLVLDNYPDTTIDVESDANVVVATGHDDHIVCSAGAFHDKIYVNGSDTVNSTCHNDGDPVRPDGQAPADLTRAAKAPRAHAAAGPAAYAASVSGDGSNSNPYTAPCDSQPQVSVGSSASCTVTFPERTLSGFWANEFVPAYRCPTSGLFYGNFPYLVNQGFAPAGTTLPNGVEVQGLGPVGVSIIQHSTSNELYYSTGHFYATGTLTDVSSATNWTLGSNSYRVILHCTNDALHSGYY